MRELTNTATAALRSVGSFTRAHARTTPHDHIIVEEDPETGPRLKYFSRTADVSYWTQLWKEQQAVSYSRESRGHLPHQLRDTFKRWVEPGARVLEAGCGMARFTVAAQALSYRAEGLDWSAETIENLRRRFPSVPWHVGDVRKLEFCSGAFDAVYSPGVCEHFEEGPAAILLETRRVLRPGGIAIVSTPCFNTWLRRHTGNLTSDAVPGGLPFYQYAFTPDGMARLLTRLGFEVLQIRPYASLDTLIQYGRVRIPAQMVTGLALLMDYLPVLRQWGSTCLWVARRC